MDDGKILGRFAEPEGVKGAENIQAAQEKCDRQQDDAKQPGNRGLAIVQQSIEDGIGAPAAQRGVLKKQGKKQKTLRDLLPPRMSITAKQR